jgi:hypothetical protein
VLYERGACLYEHLLRLHELLSELGVGRVSIEELEPALLVLKP